MVTSAGSLIYGICIRDKKVSVKQWLCKNGPSNDHPDFSGFSYWSPSLTNPHLPICWTTGKALSRQSQNVSLSIFSPVELLQPSKLGHIPGPANIKEMKQIKPRDTEMKPTKLSFCECFFRNQIHPLMSVRSKSRAAKEVGLKGALNYTEIIHVPRFTLWQFNMAMNNGHL